jgi:hypothetical protein
MAFSLPDLLLPPQLWERSSCFGMILLQRGLPLIAVGGEDAAPSPLTIFQPCLLLVVQSGGEYGANGRFQS